MSTVTVFNMLAQLVGIVRMMIIAAALGLSGLVDAYYLALALPTLLVVVAGNWVQISFLGRYTTLLSERDFDGAHSFQLAIMLVLVLVSLPLLAIFWSFPALIMEWFVGEQHQALSASALPYVGLMILPVIVADFMGRTLNGHHRYAIAAIAPFANAVTATLCLWYWPEKDLAALVGSLLAGVAVQLLIVLPSYVLLGRGRQAQLLKVWPELSEVFKITLWVIPAMLLANAMLSIMQFGVSSLGEGAVSMMGYASRINSGFTQLLIIGFGAVLIPYFAKLIAEQDFAEIQSTFRRLIRGAVVACITLSLGVYLLGAEFVALLFARGEFSSANAQSVALLLWVLTLSLLPLSVGSFVARYFNSLRRADLLFMSAVLGFVGTCVGVVLGLYYHSVLLVGIAPLLCYSITAIFWLRELAKHIDVKPLLSDLWSGLGRVLFFLLPIWLIDFALLQALSVSNDALFAVRVLSFVGVFGLIGYFSHTTKWVLNVSE